MTAAVFNSFGVFLRRFSVLVGVLAIVAGIFGMHIMTGAHHTPPAAALTGEKLHVAQEPAAGQALPRPAMAGPGSHSMSTMPSSCTDASGCATSSTADGTCIPSPGHASLAAPPPGSTALTDQSQAAVVATLRYAYLPGSPSPGELCISRT